MMSETFANRDYSPYPSRDRGAAARADYILAQAERRGPAASPMSRVRESTTLRKLNQLDQLAVAVTVIMTIGPLFAASVGAMFY